MLSSYFLLCLWAEFLFDKRGQKPENCLFVQYHAPQTDVIKDEILRQLTATEVCKIRVVFATVAIGIGVNIPKVRHVIHLDVPQTVKWYYQEIGRAGWDNQPARATLHYNGSDVASNKPGMTDEMWTYCKLTNSCLRDYVLTYLGSTRSSRPPIPSQLCCSNCSNSEQQTLKKQEVEEGSPLSKIKALWEGYLRRSKKRSVSIY